MSELICKGAFRDVNMGLGHDGLRLVALKVRKLDVSKLGEGEIVIFVNRTMDKVKILGGAGLVFGYIRMPNKRRITMDAIQFIPKSFSGGAINYDQALKEALIQMLEKDSKRKGKGSIVGRIIQ